MVFSCLVAFCMISSLNSFRVHFNVIYSLGNSQKSHGDMSGEYGAWQTTGMLCVAMKAWITCAEWALSWWTNLAVTLLMCKSSVKIECTDPILNPNSVAISQTVIWRYCMIAVCTCSITLSFRLVEGQSERGLLSTDVQPFLKRLYHSFIREVLMALSPKACWMVSTW